VGCCEPRRGRPERQWSLALCWAREAAEEKDDDDDGSEDAEVWLRRMRRLLASP
jgi:hypothetical protein